jgi:glycosyltransferase involved in cell wall biosynthesis
MTDRALLAVVPNTRGTSPGQRTSIEAWEPVLAEAGWEVHYAEFADAELEELLRRPGRAAAKAAGLAAAYRRQAARVLRQAGDHDAVLVYREAALLGPAVLERLAARRAPLVYELDDPLHVPYASPVNGGFARLKCFGKVPRVCGLADAVVVNSRPLERFAAARNRHVVRIPSLVSDRYLAVERPPSTAPVCIGWVGSRTTTANLEPLAPTLARLQAELGVVVRVVSDATPDLPGVEVDRRPWSAATEAVDCATFDIGLAPLPDVPWNQWKFFLKVAQYMALGIPTVASAVGPIADQVDDGVTGYVVAGDDAWYDRLHSLATDPGLRRRLGTVAAARALASYTLSANAEAIRDVFESVTGGARR